MPSESEAQGAGASKKSALKKGTTRKKTTAAKKATTSPAKKKSARKKAASKGAWEATALPASGGAETVVVARCDLGFGNQLFIRGQGGGLSWESGQPMQNVDADEWVWTTARDSEEIEFKLLANDLTWSAGENMRAKPGAKVVVVPSF